MRNNSFLAVSLSAALLVTALIGCNRDDDEPSQNEELTLLQIQLNSIFQLAQATACDDPAEWYTVAYGSKPCGGPRGYLAYHESVDSNLLFGLIEDHAEAEAAYNQKYNVTSDCETPPIPSGVTCSGDVPVLVFP